MRYIRKGVEPELRASEGNASARTTLGVWQQGTSEWVPSSWDDLQNPMKRDLWLALLREQGYICCYCGIRVEYGATTIGPIDVPEREGSHIEHVLPREHFPERTFAYDNLLISCQGHQEEPREPKHCGTHKGDWPSRDKRDRFIAPTQQDCASRFRYLGNGEVLPASDHDDAAAETIRRLNLNVPRLRANRELILEELDHELEDQTLRQAGTPEPLDDRSTHLAREYLDAEPGADNEHRLPAFLAAIQYTLLSLGTR